MQLPNRPISDGHDYAYNRPVNICVPAESFDIAYSAPAGIYDVETMSFWMDLPLLTADHIMSLVWPQETRGYCMKSQHLYPVSRMPDADLYREYYYKKVEGVDGDDVRDPVCKLIIAQLVPWACIDNDLEEFVRVSHVCVCSGVPVWQVVDGLSPLAQFPAYSAEQILRGNAAFPTYSRVHRIWAKVRKRPFV